MKAKTSHVHLSDLRGAGQLAIDATLGLTSLVETLHHNILRTPGVLGAPTQEPATGITGFVYRCVRGVTRAVGGAIDAALPPLERLLGGKVSSAQRDAVVAALNGVLGDHLQASGNPLAIRMQWRRAGAALDVSHRHHSRAGLKAAIPDATGKVLLLVHGLCMNDRQWHRNGHDHGAALAAEKGFTPIYLHYNTGLPIGSNARELAHQIEALLHAWPVQVRELVILAHSMGGLVARGACHYAEAAGHDWLHLLRTIIFLGTPHHGAPLERGGRWVDVVLDASPYTTAFSRLGKIRSAGITDLRHGTVLENTGKSRRRAMVPLPAHVECHALAACITKASRPLAERLLGDGLVPVDSALGRHADASRDLGLSRSHCWTGYGMNHMDLLDRAAVYAQITRRV